MHVHAEEENARRLANERAYAAMRGEEYVEPIELGLRWDPVAPLAHVVTGGTRAVVVCFLASADADPGDRWVRMVDTSDEQPVELGVVSLGGCFGVRTGGDALAFEGHGLVPDSAHVVKNSLWLEELDVPGVHHFLLPFATGAVEAVAAELRVESVETSVRDALSGAVARLLA